MGVSKGSKKSKQSIIVCTHQPEDCGGRHLPTIKGKVQHLTLKHAGIAGNVTVGLIGNLGQRLGDVEYR